MANQNIQLKDQSGNLLFPRTKWKDVIDHPTTLPNAGVLTINGQTYNGSADVTVNVQGGGSTVEVLQTTGTSTTAAMSQNAITIELDELRQLIEDYHYVPISISSFSVDPAQAEIGSTVSSAILRWTLAGAAPTEIKYNNIALSSSATNVTLTGLALKSNTTYTLYVKDARGATAQRNITLAFRYRAYWGVAAASSTYNSSFILGLAGSALTSTRARTITLSANTDEYIYYAIPVSFGTPTFNVGGFDGGFTKVATIDHTNASGSTASYNIYRSDNANLGTQTIKIG